MNEQQRRHAHAVLRNLGGTNLHILLALFIEARPTTKKHLAMVTGYSYNTVSKAVDLLEYEGRIDRAGYRAWTLPNKQQIPLPGFDNLLPGHSPALPSGPAETSNSDVSTSMPEPETSSPAVSTPEPEPETSNLDISTPEPALEASSSAVSTPEPEAETSNSDVSTPEPESETSAVPTPESEAETSNSDVSTPGPAAETPNFDVSGTTTTTAGTVEKEKKVVGTVRAEAVDFDVSAEVAAALGEIRVGGRGIGRNRWAEIAGYGWVTPRYLQAMAAWVDQHPEPRFRNTGFFIHCVRSQDPAPAWCEACGGLNGEHAPECSRYEPDYQRYLNDKYTEALEY